MVQYRGWANDPELIGILGKKIDPDKRKWKKIWSKMSLCSWIRIWTNWTSWRHSTDLCSCDRVDFVQVHEQTYEEKKLKLRLNQKVWEFSNQRKLSASKARRGHCRLPLFSCSVIDTEAKRERSGIILGYKYIQKILYSIGAMVALGSRFLI